MEPSIDAVAEHGWAVRQIDVEHDLARAIRYNITQVPTTLILRQGKEVDRIVGSLSANELHSRLVQSGSLTKMPAPNSLATRQLDPNHVAARRNQPAHAAAIGQPIAAGLSHMRTVRGQSPTNGADGQFAMGGTAMNNVAMNNVAMNSVAMGNAMTPLGGRSHQQLISSTRQTNDLNPSRSNTFFGNDSLSNQRADPSASTVRIRVDDPQSQSIGTGTIIDRHNREALVVTCGHLFRDMPANAKILVEYWTQGQMRTVEGTLVDFTANETDIGLIAFATDDQLSVSPVLPGGTPLSPGAPVYSLGCDGGQDPSRRDSRITKINRYLGPQNVEVAGAPTQGRSGGGLFDANGYLIGVCYAKDDELDEGLYSGPQVIYAQLNKFGLDHLTFVR
jgi:S1-C subfamily serine protease